MEIYMQNKLSFFISAIISISSSTYATETKKRDPLPNKSLMTDSQKRELKIQLIGGAITLLKVAAIPAVALASLTGCVDMKDAGTCPVFNYDFVDGSKFLSNREISKLKEFCSPKAIGYPENFFNSDDFSLPENCRSQLKDVIPWYSSIRDGVTTYENKLKNQYIKTIWMNLFIPRLSPSLTSASGLNCPDIELDLLGADEISDTFNYETWLAGDYMDKRLLNVIKGANIRTGFKSSDLCDSSIAYFSQEDNNFYICKSGEYNLTDFGVIGSGMTLAHELRHSADLFDSGTHHVDCSNGKTNCDEGELGAYGTGIIYLDQLLNGLRLLHNSSSDSSTKEQIITSAKSAINFICLYRSNILNRESVYFNTLSSYGVCSDPSDEEIQSFLGEQYLYEF